MADGETTNPGARHELTDRDRSAIELYVAQKKAQEAWGNRIKIGLAVLISLGTVAVSILAFGDRRWMGRAEAAGPTGPAAIHNADKEDDAHPKIRKLVDDTKDKIEGDAQTVLDGLKQEITNRRLQGKDVEINRNEIARQERRLRRLEDRQ